MNNYIHPENWNYPINFIPFYSYPKSYEIACMLFENCNLSCKFCFETHQNKKIDLDYILTIPDIITKNFKKEYKKYKDIKTLYLMLWGGEIFYDTLPDIVFDTYIKFIDKINFIFKKEFPYINVIFSWLSNGVFTKYERIEKIITYSKGIINFSYDPINRFKSEKQLQTMVASAKYFKKKGLGDKISITLTKDSIRGFIDKDKYLKEFNDMGYNLDVNYYIANPNWKELLPTDEEIFSFLKWAINNDLFNMKILQKVFCYFLNEKPSHYCDCKSCAQITYGTWSKDCAKCSSVLPAQQFYGKYTPIINEENSNDIKATIGINKRGCLFCKYYQFCQMPCWISIVFNEFKPTNCFYKQIYEYLENNPSIIDKYKKMLDKNYNR